MKKIIGMFIILTSFILAFVGCNNTASQDFSLSKEEKAWLEKNPIIYYAPDPEFAPYEYFEFAELKGIVPEYLNYFEELLGIRIAVLPTESWSQALTMGMNGTADMLFMTRTAERESFFEFSAPFLFSPNVILTNENSKDQFDINKIYDYNIGILEDYSSSAYLKLIYPESKTSTYSSIVDGLSALNFEEVDGLLVDLGQATYYMDRLKFKNFNVGNEIGFEYKFSFAVTKNNEILSSIINKAILSIDEKKHLEIMDKWSYLKHSSLISNKQFQLFYYGLILIVILVITIITWNRILKNKVSEKTKALELLNKDLEKRVHDRTQELNNLNIELKDSIENLTRTQEQLVESKKYAALGQIVSKVAHEINTPVGNSITCLSYNQKILSRLESFENKMMSEDISKLIDSTNSAYNNVEIASNIINRFKQMEMSLISQEEETINIYNLISRQVENMIYEKLIPASVTTNIDVEKNLQMHTTKLLLEIIVKNIILNSVQHGFDSIGQITIIGYEKENIITLIFEDNGKGIDKKNYKDVFEPFFTTKPSKENIGLGLSIIHNIVVNNLSGNIKIESEKGQFTRLVLKFEKK